jgi:succinate dehydrogenase / fumarate reductase membrane anchor subunit
VSRAAQGLRAWLLQRITAVYLAVYILSALFSLLTRNTVDFPVWHNWLASPWTGVATTLFALSLLLHVWVGIRDVLIDYVHPVSLRLLFMVVTALILLGSLLWVIRALAVTAMQGEI